MKRILILLTILSGLGAVYGEDANGVDALSEASVQTDAVIMLWNENYALWDANRPTDYYFILSFGVSHWYYFEIGITVNDGTVTDYEIVDSWGLNTYKDRDITSEFAFTIDGVYDWLYASEVRYTTAYFDEDYGYPTDIFYDEPELMDEEEAMHVTEFEVIAE